MTNENVPVVASPTESATSKNLKEESTQNRFILNGNGNIWWILGSLISVWFTCGRGFPFLATFPRNDKYPAVAAHVLLASIISWLCIWNLFHTPSHGPTYKWLHVIAGRIAVVVGAISAILGFITVWYLEYEGASGFAIGISIGGVLQLWASGMGWYHIRKYLEYKKQLDTDDDLSMELSEVRIIDIQNKMKKHINAHIRFMTFFFFGGCLIPAVMRLPQMTGTVDIVGTSFSMYSWIFPLFGAILFIRAVTKDSWY